MRVKLKVSRAGYDETRGAHGGYSQSCGDVIDVPDEEGERMIAARLAIAAGDENETATRDDGCTAHRAGGVGRGQAEAWAGPTAEGEADRLNDPGFTSNARQVSLSGVVVSEGRRWDYN